MPDWLNLLRCLSEFSALAQCGFQFGDLADLALCSAEVGLPSPCSRVIFVAWHLACCLFQSPPPIHSLHISALPFFLVTNLLKPFFPLRHSFQPCVTNSCFFAKPQGHIFYIHVNFDVPFLKTLAWVFSCVLTSLTCPVQCVVSAVGLTPPLVCELATALSCHAYVSFFAQ